MTGTNPDNKSFVLRGIHDTVYEQRPIPEFAKDEVLIEIAKTGICGSDVHYLNHGRIGDFVVEAPMCLGHESSGTVHAVGSDVKSLKVGDRVALEPKSVCRVCEYCKTGRYNLCQSMTFAATPPFTGGTLGRYYALGADMCHKLPDNVDMEDGAMMEPLSVAVHALASVGNLKTDQNVAVYGCGPVGLLCMAVAKALGARRVIAIDINAERLAFAKQYIATDTYQPPAPEANETRPEFSKRTAHAMASELGFPIVGRDGIDLVIDASGAEVCIQSGLHLVKPGGTYVQVGMGAPDIQIPMFLVLTKEIKVYGSFRYGPGDYPLAVSLVGRGLIDLKPLVTHRYEFDDALEAFHATQKGKSEDGKAVIKCIISAPK